MCIAILFATCPHAHYRIGSGGRNGKGVVTSVRNMLRSATRFTVPYTAVTGAA